MPCLSGHDMYRSSYTVKIPTRPLLSSIQPEPSNRPARAVSLSFSWPCWWYWYWYSCCCWWCYYFFLYLVLILAFTSSRPSKVEAATKCPIIPSVHFHPSLIPFPTQPTHSLGNPPVDSVQPVAVSAPAHQAQSAATQRACA
ncbi:hypothetical protein LZ32DRAFT_603666 [Colletotrichum eremochloae]|nr:hypothetical protein LZ32DRAFT_603666 [Colletotrichum eremochloae]